MTERTFLVLDFDGVICDSIDECFLTSWIAYHSLYLGERADPVPGKAPDDFAMLRPFIRTAEDFVVIQEMLATGESARDQAGFDAVLARAGKEKRELFRRLAHEARTGLLEKDRNAWLAMNGVYPHVKEALLSMRSFPRVAVLSTKRREFIIEILRWHGIGLTEERIFESVHEPKLVTTERLRLQGGCERAYLVEDQVDAIKGNTNTRVEGRLATWGYVRKEWLTPPLAAPLISPEEFLALVEELVSAL
jgi:phosphoglycolate phosphatase-like HAD superfamily hydrolase